MNAAHLLQFSSERLPGQKRLDAWREVFSRAVLKSDVTPVNQDEPFHARMALQHLPGLSITWGSSSSLRIERPPGLVADGDDDLILILSLAGQATGQQCGRELQLEPGGAVLWANGVPGRFRCSQNYSLTQLKLPARGLQTMVRDVEGAVMRPLDRRGKALAVLAGYVAALRLTLDRTAPEARLMFATHIRDLVALTLGADADTADLARRRGLRAARLAAVRAYIAENLTRPDLGVRQVAARQSISPRYLQMLFDAEGATFSEFVLEQRLARIHRLLTDPRLDKLPIGVIALDAGFGDLSYFNRVFRRRYGATPSEIRAAAARENNDG